MQDCPSTAESRRGSQGRSVACRLQVSSALLHSPWSDVAQEVTPLRFLEHFRLMDPPNFGFLVSLAKRQSVAG